MPQPSRGNAGGQGADAHDGGLHAERGASLGCRNQVDEVRFGHAVGEAQINAVGREEHPQGGQRAGQSEAQVDGGEEREAGDQNALAAEAVGDDSSGVGREHIQGIADGEEQHRDGAGGAELAGAQDEKHVRGVADRKQQRHHQEAAQRGIGGAEVEGEQRARAARRGGVAHGENQQRAHQARDEGDEEGRAVVIVQGGQDGERRQRSEHGADAVAAALEAEGAAAKPGGRGVGDDGVARAAANAFAEAVEHARGQHQRPAIGQRQKRLGEGGQSVTGQHQRLAAAPPVGKRAGNEFQEPRGGFGDSFDEADDLDGRAQDIGEKQRHQRIDHLARKVGEEAHHGEQQDVSRDAAEEGRFTRQIRVYSGGA